MMVSKDAGPYYQYLHINTDTLLLVIYINDVIVYNRKWELFVDYVHVS